MNSHLKNAFILHNLKVPSKVCFVRLKNKKNNLMITMIKVYEEISSLQNNKIKI